MESAVNNTCPDGYQIIYNSALFSHECVTTALQLAAVSIGFSSVIFWFFAQAPQVLKSWKSGEADQAFSLFFLVEWAFGDAFNLAGSILAHQLSFQIWQAGYFCLMDIILTAQFFVAYLRRKVKRRVLLEGDSDTEGPRRSLPALCLLAVFVPITFLATRGESIAGNGFGQAYATESLHTGRRLLAASPPASDDKSFEVFLPSVQKDALYGYILGSISAFFYVVAGFPQAYKNYQRKSCEGLSVFMFILAALGNITYALGIFLFSTNHMFLLNKLPWLAGSLGSLLYQFTILFQFFIYSRDRVCFEMDREQRQPLNSEDYAQPVDYSAVDS